MGSRRNVIQWLGASHGYLEKGRETVRVPKSVEKRGGSPYPWGRRRARRRTNRR